MQKNTTQKKQIQSRGISILLFLFLGLFSFQMNAQSVSITVNPGTTGNGPMGSSNYHVSEHIYLQSEINTAININYVAFNMTTLGGTVALNTFTNVKIYFKTTTATTFAAGAYNTTGYTQVYSGTMTWNAAGFAGVSTTPFNYTNTPGTNLQMMVVRTDNITHVGPVFSASIGNSTNSALNTCRRYNSTLAPVLNSSALALTTFRASVTLGNLQPNDLAVSNIYTLGKFPIEYGAPTIIQARIVNVGTAAMPAGNVNLSITGANSFTNSQPYNALSPGASQIINFANYAPTSLSIGDIVTVNIPTPDNANGNNTLTWNQDITQNIYTYKNPAVANAGGVGFTGATGDFVAKFNSNPGVTYPYTTNPKINEIQVDFTTTGNTYKLGVWDATGTGGTPGVLLWESAVLTTAIGTAFVPVPDVPVAGDYFVGVRQTGTVNCGFAYQAENPIRGGTFYYTSPTGATAWNDFQVSNSAFRFSIVVQVHIPQPPNCAASLTPADNTIGACLSPTLSWASGGGGPTSYDVYFSTSQFDVDNLSTFALVSAAQTGLTYSPGALIAGTQYFWKVIPKNSDGDAVGCATQNFTTTPIGLCYCVPSHTGTLCASGIISNVTFNTLSSTTSCAAPAYTIFPFSGSTTTNVNANSSVNLSVTTDTASIISVWIDYNHDNIFDVSEWTQVTIASVANVASIIPISIPLSAMTGPTMMRVRSRLINNINGSVDACTAFGSGESEDYVITIDPALPCTTPTPGATLSTATSVCIGAGFTVSIANTSNGLGTTYQWQSSPDNITYTDISGAVSSSYAVASQSAATYYRCNAICPTSSTTVPSTPIQVTMTCDVIVGGTTNSTNTNPCSGAAFTLTLAGNSATCVSYQWQSSSDGITYTDISGATNNTLATSETATTYFHCVITCTGGSSSATSSDILVTLNPVLSQCYCIPVTSCSFPDIITNVTYGTINRTSVCDAPTGGWSLYTTPNPSFNIGSTDPISVSTGGDVEGVAVWIDFNQSGTFDPSELVLNGYTATNPATYTGNVTIPMNAVTGTTRMRVRCTYATDPSTTLGPCANTTYGETEDYDITIVNPTATLALVCYIQGYYLGAGMMTPTIQNEDLDPLTAPNYLATDCDNITVELHQDNSSTLATYPLVATFTGLLQTNGTLSCTFPGSVVGMSCYVVIKHRNTLETWSKLPITIAATNTYNFSTAANKALGDNQIDVASEGIYSLYNGDMNQDYATDATDFLLMDMDIQSFNSGYINTDLNGDGSTDASDFLILDGNIQGFIGAIILP